MAAQPRFDCGNAAQPLDRLICAEPQMANLDRDMVFFYGDQRGALAANRDVIRLSQRAWAKLRDELCKIPGPEPPTGRA